MSKSEKLAKDFTCECGIVNKFDMYVYAHWTLELTHTCACGRKHLIQRGIVTLLMTSRKAHKKDSHVEH